MNRNKFLFLGVLSIVILSGCSATEAEKHALGMEVVRQTIRSAFNFGTAAALKSIK